MWDEGSSFSPCSAGFGLCRSLPADFPQPFPGITDPAASPGCCGGCLGHCRSRQRVTSLPDSEPRGFACSIPIRPRQPQDALAPLALLGEVGMCVPDVTPGPHSLSLHPQWAPWVGFSWGSSSLGGFSAAVGAGLQEWVTVSPELSAQSWGGCRHHQLPNTTQTPAASQEPGAVCFPLSCLIPTLPH